MRIVSFTQARNNLKSVLDSVSDDNGDCTVITRRDAEDAVVMSLDHYNSLVETLHLLRSPANAAHLQKSLQQHDAGNVIELGVCCGPLRPGLITSSGKTRTARLFVGSTGWCAPFCAIRTKALENPNR